MYSSLNRKQTESAKQLVRSTGVCVFCVCACACSPCLFRSVTLPDSIIGGSRLTPARASLGFRPPPALAAAAVPVPRTLRLTVVTGFEMVRVATLTPLAFTVLDLDVTTEAVAVEAGPPLPVTAATEFLFATAAAGVRVEAPTLKTRADADGAPSAAAGGGGIGWTAAFFAGPFLLPILMLLVGALVAAFCWRNLTSFCCMRSLLPLTSMSEKGVAAATDFPRELLVGA